MLCLVLVKRNPNLHIAVCRLALKEAPAYLLKQTNLILVFTANLPKICFDSHLHVLDIL